MGSMIGRSPRFSEFTGKGMNEASPSRINASLNKKNFYLLSDRCVDTAKGTRRKNISKSLRTLKLLESWYSLSKCSRLLCSGSGPHGT